MGQSIDYRKIELVSQFAGLLEAFSDPNLKATIKEAQKVVDEKKALLGPLATKQNLEAYLDKTETEINEKKLKMEELLGQAKVEADRIIAEATSKKNEAMENLAEAKSIKNDAQEALATARQAVSEQKKISEHLEKEKAALAVVKLEVEAQLEALKVKQAKLQQVLGE